MGIYEVYFFFFNDTATTEIYTLSLHDALPISAAGLRHAGRRARRQAVRRPAPAGGDRPGRAARRADPAARSEEHTSELQSRQYLVCRLLLEKKTQISHLTSSALKSHYYINVLH